MNTKKQKVLLYSAILYAAVMLALLLLRERSKPLLPYSPQLMGHVNLVPFLTIRRYLRCFRPPYRPWLVRAAVLNLAGNIVLFIPLGWFPPMLQEKMRRFWKTLLASAGAIVIVELLQLFLLVGTCDIDDLLLNLIGAAIGYSFYRMMHRKAVSSSDCSE